MTMTLKEEKNLYEDILKEANMNGFDREVRKFIKALPVHQQRKAILKVMVDNNVEHNLLFGQIQKVVKGNELYTARHIKNVVKMLREYVSVSATEKKKFGEVMTPTTLVNDMLDTLPNEVWNNPDLRWLDPCNGVGIFPAVIIERLMDGLCDFEPDEELRYQHIIEEMIFVSELQAKNLFLYMYAFDPEDRYAMNVYCGSYLESGFDKHMDFWGIEEFDIVVMNPPYQTQQKGNTKTQALWDKFINNAIENHVSENGYLVAVHPDSWRNIGGHYKNTQNLLKEREMLYLEMHSTKDGNETFGANTTYDFYCLRNKLNNNFLTKIVMYDGKNEMHNISKYEFIPNVNIRFVMSLTAKNGEEKVMLINNSSYHTQKLDRMSKEQNNEFKYPCVYTVGALNPNFWYSNNDNDKTHFVPKVIWGNGLTDVIVDKKGEYGLTQFAYAISDEQETLKGIQIALKSKEFIKGVMGYTKGVGHIYNRKIIATFRKDFWKEFV